MCTALALAACSGGHEGPLVGVDAPADAPQDSLPVDGPLIDSAIDAAIDGAVVDAIDAPTDAPVDAAIDAAPAQGCVVSTSMIVMTELERRMVGVTLALPPSGSVDVAIASADTSIVTVTPATLTFTAANYATPQMIQIDSAADFNTIHKYTTVSCTVPGVAPTNIMITINDQTDPFPYTDLSIMTLDEGATGMFRVRLGAMPAGTSNFTVTSGDVGAVTASPATFQILSANWDMWHDVMVTAVQDADAVDESVWVTVSAPGMPSSVVMVNVNDDD